MEPPKDPGLPDPGLHAEHHSARAVMCGNPARLVPRIPKVTRVLPAAVPARSPAMRPSRIVPAGTQSSGVARAAREALVHPVGEVVDDRDGAFDALGGPDQPLGVAAGRDLARERDDAVPDVDLHALRVGAQHLLDDLGADRLVVAQEHRQHVRPGDDADDPARRVAHRHPAEVTLHHQARRGRDRGRRRHRLDELRHELGRGGGARLGLRLVAADVAGPPAPGLGVGTGGGGHQVGLGDDAQQHPRRIDDRYRPHSGGVQQPRQVRERRLRWRGDELGRHHVGDDGAVHRDGPLRLRAATAVPAAGAGSVISAGRTTVTGRLGVQNTVQPDRAGLRAAGRAAAAMAEHEQSAPCAALTSTRPGAPVAASTVTAPGQLRMSAEDLRVSGTSRPPS